MLINNDSSGTNTVKSMFRIRIRLRQNDSDPSDPDPDPDPPHWTAYNYSFVEFDLQIKLCYFETGAEL